MSERGLRDEENRARSCRILKGMERNGPRQGVCVMAGYGRGVSKYFELEVVYESMVHSFCREESEHPVQVQ